MNLLQIKSRLSKLKSVSSTSLDWGQLIAVVMSAEAAWRMGILERRDEHYCKYWWKLLPGIGNQNSPGLGSILGDALQFPKPLLYQRSLKGGFECPRHLCSQLTVTVFPLEKTEHICLKASPFLRTLLILLLLELFNHFLQNQHGKMNEVCEWKDGLEGIDLSRVLL